MTAPNQRELEHTLFIELSQVETEVLTQTISNLNTNIQELREFLNRLETRLRITRRILADRAAKEKEKP